MRVELEEEDGAQVPTAIVPTHSAKLLKSISSADSRDSQSLSQGVLIGGFGSFALVVNNISGPGPRGTQTSRCISSARGVERACS